MLKNKRGASMFSIVLCLVAMTLIIATLLIVTNNSATMRAQWILNNSNVKVESLAYTKIYNINEVKDVARQAYANNYLDFYDHEINFEEFKTLVMNEIMKTIPTSQLDSYNIDITPDGIDVQYK